MSYDTDLERLSNVIKRVIRGLYYKHFGSIIKPEYVDGWCLNGIQKEGIELLSPLINRLLCNKPIEIGNKVFKYWYEQTGIPEEQSSFWYLLFYDTVGFYGLTGKDDYKNT